MPINWRFLAWWVPVNLLAVATAAAFSLYVILRAVEAAAIRQDGYAGFLVSAWLVFAFLAVLPSFVCEVANAWRRLVMKQQIVAVPEPDWRDLLWRVGLVTVLAPAILVFVAR